MWDDRLSHPSAARAELHGARPVTGKLWHGMQQPSLANVVADMSEEMTVEFRRLLIMASGIATTLCVLVLVATTSFGEMLYAYHRIGVWLPTGAFSLGVLAGSGYGVAGWFLTRLRFTPAMLKAIFASMVVAYVGTALIEYAHAAPNGMRFFDYFDRSTRSSSWGEGSVFGAEGYSYRVLELLGLSVGGMGGLFVVPALRQRGVTRP